MSNYVRIPILHLIQTSNKVWSSLPVRLLLNKLTMTTRAKQLNFNTTAEW